MECYKSSLRNFRMVGCTKRGKESYLKILSNHTDYDCMICFIGKTCKLIDITPGIVKKIKEIKPLIHSKERTLDFNELVLQNMHVIAPESDDYGSWINWCIAMNKANLPLETFLEFSKQSDDKYNEKKAIKKWESVKYEKNAGDLINRLKKLGIDVSTFTTGEIKHEIGVKSDLEAGQMIIKLYPHWKYCEKVLYIFDNKTGMWSDDENIHHSIIAQFAEDLHYLNHTSEGWKKTRKSYGSNSALMSNCMKFLKTECIDNEWIKQNQNSSPGKLLFKNGYLNLKTNEFVEEFNPDIVFFAGININYYEQSHAQINYSNDLFHRLFVIPLGDELANYFLLNLARALAGDMMKRFLFGLGCGNSGKSTLVKAYQLSFGNYIGTFNAENLVYKESVAEESSKMRWVLLQRASRIIFSNEIKDGVCLDGNFIKKLSSGGDALSARMLYQCEQTFVPQFLTILMSNDISQIKPYDKAVDNRVRIISYPKVFVEHEPQNEFELEMDKNLDNEMLTPEFQEALIHLTISRYLKFIKEGSIEYEPAEVLKGKNEWIGEKDEIGYVDKFKKVFEITNDEQDYIESSSIQQWITNYNICISMTKM